MGLIKLDHRMEIINSNQGMGLIESNKDIQLLHRQMFNHNKWHDTQLLH